MEAEKEAPKPPHNPEAAGSSPAPAIKALVKTTGAFFCFKGDFNQVKFSVIQITNSECWIMFRLICEKITDRKKSHRK